MTNTRTTIERALELVLVTLITASLCGLLLAILGVFKAPQSVLVGIIGASFYAVLTRKDVGKAGLRPRASGWHVLGLLLVGLIFRLPPSDYVSGGQDQGVYVNIAAHIVHSGGIAIDDRVRSKLDGSSAAGTYDQDNAVGGDFLLGIFQRGEGADKTLQFQFYHLFPVIMALAGGTLGLGASVYALTALSLLSILFFYVLALEVTQRPRVAAVAAFLLAINPLHAFFSRFPVSEVPTLCFTLAASWLLVRMWRNHAETDPGHQRLWWGILSAAALGCAFLTRISGFMYMPVVFLIGGAVCLWEVDRPTRRMFLLWTLLVNAVFALSVLYGYAYSPIYTKFQFEVSFGSYLGLHWRVWILSLWALGILALAALYVSGHEARFAKPLRNVVSTGDRCMGALLLLALALGLYRLYQLGWSERYATDAWLSQRWHIARTGAGVFSFSSFVVAAEYSSPFVLALFMALAWKRELPGVLRILLAFVLLFHFYLTGPQWLIPYQPYYARYLVSEYVPYVILFVVSAYPFIRSSTYRGLALWMFALGGIWSLALSIGQLRANEQHAMAQSYQRIASRIGDDDLLLLDTDTLSLPHQLIEMPFMLRYGRHVARISRGSLENGHYLNGLQTRFDGLYLLSGKSIPPESFQLVDSVHFREVVAEQSNHPPLRSNVRNQGRTYLYMRASGVTLPGDWTPVVPNGASSNIFVDGWSIPESWGIWSDGSEAFVDIPKSFARGGRPNLLELAVKPFITAGHPRQRVLITVDGGKIRELSLASPAVIDIPLESDQSSATERYRVRFDLPDAVTPKEAGVSSADPRRLAIGVTSVRVASDPAPTQPR
jgi:4-amino-4-deoxy-L-arabinose transferase-like glycosyltransferase